MEMNDDPAVMKQSSHEEYPRKQAGEGLYLFVRLCACFGDNIYPGTDLIFFFLLPHFS